MARSRCRIRSWQRKRQWRAMAPRIEPLSSGGTRRWRRRKRHRCADLTGRMRGRGYRASAVGQRRHPTTVMWRMRVAVIAMRVVRGMTRDRPGMVEVQGVWSDMRGRRMRGTEPARAEEVLQLLAPGRVEMSRVVAALYVKASALRSLGGYARRTSKAWSGHSAQSCRSPRLEASWVGSSQATTMQSSVHSCVRPVPHSASEQVIDMHPLQLGSTTAGVGIGAAARREGPGSLKVNMGISFCGCALCIVRRKRSPGREAGE
jgi:hypothetical protein